MGEVRECEDTCTHLFEISEEKVVILVQESCYLIRYVAGVVLQLELLGSECRAES